MTRVKKDADQLAAMCQRLVEVIDLVYAKSDVDMAAALGYKNPSPLYRIREGLTFPDVERLARLVAHQPEPHVAVNLNWIIAGRGAPLLRYPPARENGMQIAEFIDARLRR